MRNILEPIQLNILDYILIGVLSFSVLISVIRGFVKEALSLASWILAIWIAITFVNPFAMVLEGIIDNLTIRMATAFISLFVCTLIIGALVNFMISQLVHKTGLSGTDRVLGIFFGLSRGLLVIALFVMLANFTSVPQTKWWQSSLLIEHFQTISDWLEGFMPDNFIQHSPTETKKQSVIPRG